MGSEFEQHRIQPHKVTKPIQLLAAWLVGLFVVNGSFLATAVALPDGWLRSLLIIAAVLDVPLFLVAIFVLQTRFRPEMQEDTFYAQYLDKKTNRPLDSRESQRTRSKLEFLEAEVLRLAGLLRRSPAVTREAKGPAVGERIWKVAVNDHVPRHEEIRTELEGTDLFVHDVFGRVNKSGRPSKLVLTVHKSLDGGSVAKLIDVARRHEIDGVSVFNRHDPPEANPSDIYFGTYDHEATGYVPLDTALTAQAKKPDQLVRYIVTRQASRRVI